MIPKPQSFSPVIARFRAGLLGNIEFRGEHVKSIRRMEVNFQWDTFSESFFRSWLNCSCTVLDHYGFVSYYETHLHN